MGQRQGPKATVRNPERKREWEAIFGMDIVPIKSILPISVNVLGIGDTAAYELDLQRINLEQWERLVDHLARKFDMTPESAAITLAEEGVPVLVEDVIVTGDDIGLFL